jgi:hypothetical protein
MKKNLREELPDFLGDSVVLERNLLDEDERGGESQNTLFP